MPEIAFPTDNTSRTRTRTYDVSTQSQIIADLIRAVLPTGTILPTYLTTAPNDAFAMCDGSTTLSKAAYPTLYAILAGKAGVTDTGDTFTLPDLRGRMPLGAGTLVDLGALGGADTVTLTEAQLPAHTHALTDAGHAHGTTEASHSHIDETTGSEEVQSGSGATVADYDAAGVTSAATTGLTVDSAQTGITIGDTGSGESINILNPHFGCNWMIRT